ncbi:MAG TPA: hypothetical protein VL614_04185 [Acetobacteraceae bacterium]|jgi:hypothetical protein|nr:hypothetical protein [Acetobacteraceae bacterium]
MSAVDERIARLILWLVPTIIVVVGCVLSILPHCVVLELLTIMFAWLSLSLPIGVLAGQFMTNEGERR